MSLLSPARSLQNLRATADFSSCVGSDLTARLLEPWHLPSQAHVSGSLLYSSGEMSATVVRLRCVCEMLLERFAVQVKILEISP